MVTTYNEFTGLLLVRVPSKFPEFKLLLQTKFKYPKSDLRDENGNSLFMIACQVGNLEAVKYLLSLAHTTTQDIGRNPIIIMVNHHGRTAFHEAVRANQIHVVKYLLNFNTLLSFSLVSLRVGFDTAFPHVSVCDDGEEIVNLEQRFKSCMRSLRDGLNGVDKTGWTALHFAAYNNHVQMVDLLVKCRADINSVGSKGETPLMVALQQRHSETATRLIQSNANLYARDVFGRTSLFTLCMHAELIKDWKSLVGLMIYRSSEAKSSSSSLRRIRPSSPTESIGGRSDSLKSRSSVLNIGDNRGFTPLHVAVARDNLELIRELLEFGADINLQSKEGWTVLHLASCFNYTELALYILDIPETRYDLTSKSGITILHTIAERNQHQLYKNIMKKSESTDVLLNLLDNSQRCFLHYAFYSLISAVSGTQLYLANPSQIFHHSHSHSPKHQCPHPSQINQIRFIQYILSNSSLSSLINLQDSKFNTILHLAMTIITQFKTSAGIVSEMMNVITLLIDKGADPTIESVDGWNCLHIMANETGPAEFTRLYLLLETQVRLLHSDYMRLFNSKKIKSYKISPDSSSSKFSEVIKQIKDAETSIATSNAERTSTSSHRSSNSISRVKRSGSFSSLSNSMFSSSPLISATNSKVMEPFNAVVLIDEGVSRDKIPDFLDRDRSWETVDDLIENLSKLKDFSFPNDTPPHEILAFLQLLQSKSLLQKVYTTSSNCYSTASFPTEIKVVSLTGYFNSLTCLMCDNSNEAAKGNSLDSYWRTVECLAKKMRKRKKQGSDHVLRGWLPFWGQNSGLGGGKSLATGASTSGNTSGSGDEDCGDSVTNLFCKRCGFGISVPSILKRFIERNLLKNTPGHLQELDTCTLFISFNFDNLEALSEFTSSLPESCPRLIFAPNLDILGENINMESSDVKEVLLVRGTKIESAVWDFCSQLGWDNELRNTLKSR
ncbi:Transient receptor putative cation channel sub A member 1 [Nowakowskiella sp. JEL0407]|nr:Transient receptor putative cation channel sub A member 1 [Nowakowskiella sp. JEL0407]